MAHRSNAASNSSTVRPAGGLGWPLAVLLCIAGLVLTLALGKWLHRPDWHVAAKTVVETSVDHRARVGLTREVLRGAEKSLPSDPGALAWAVAAALSLDDADALQRLAERLELADPWNEAFATAIKRSLEHHSLPQQGGGGVDAAGLALGQTPVGLVFAGLHAEQAGQPATARNAFRQAQAGARLWDLTEAQRFAERGLARAVRQAGG